jgi:hypothetical protein
MEHPSLAVSRYGTTPIKFQSAGKKTAEKTLWQQNLHTRRTWDGEPQVPLDLPRILDDRLG